MRHAGLLFTQDHVQPLRPEARTELIRHLTETQPELYLSRTEQAPGKRFYAFDSEADQGRLLVYPSLEEGARVALLEDDRVFVHWSEDWLRGGELQGVTASVDALVAVAHSQPGCWLALGDTFYRLQRRRAFRVPVPAEEPVSAQVWLETASDPIDALAMDISVMGIRVRTDRAGPASRTTRGTRARLVLHFPEHGECECPATVATRRRVQGEAHEAIDLAFVFDASPDGAPGPLTRYVRGRERSLLRHRKRDHGGT